MKNDKYITPKDNFEVSTPDQQSGIVFDCETASRSKQEARIDLQTAAN